MSRLREILLEGTDIISEDSKSFLIELVARVFTTRNLLHFEHWNTNSFAAHMALGDLYDSIVEDVDEIVECYQGKNGLVKTFRTDSIQLPVDIVQRIKDEADWVEHCRSHIAGNDSALENLIDNIIGSYYKTIYKLENLK